MLSREKGLGISPHVEVGSYLIIYCGTLPRTCASAAVYDPHFQAKRPLVPLARCALHHYHDAPLELGLSWSEIVWSDHIFDHATFLSSSLLSDVCCLSSFLLLYW